METTLDFEFGFNDAIFSNRILRLVILPDDKPTSGSKSDKHEDCRKPLCDDELQNPNGDEASQQNETSSEMHGPEREEKLIWVNSLILAAHSPFFHKLFSNGMQESGQKHATIHIVDTEEAAFMDLLKFMYSGKLVSDKPSALREVIVAADKFSVAPCLKLCGQLLNNLEMTLEVALLYLDLDLNGLMVDFVRPHLESAKKFIVVYFEELIEDELQEELLKLPLVGVEAVFSSDCLQVESEDDIYDFMLNWVQSHCSEQLQERTTTLNSLVRKFLRFPFLSIKKLESIMTCSDIDPAIASELALNALRYYKVQSLSQHTTDKFRKRAYTKLPLKGVVVDNSSSHPRCVIYLDLTREECEYILCDGLVKSQTFVLGEHHLSLGIRHKKNRNNIYCFGLNFYSPRASKTGFSIGCDIASMEKSSEEFVRRLKGDHRMLEGSTSTHWWDIFGVSWDKFISKDSPYFVNDVLLLRCDLTIKN